MGVLLMSRVDLEELALQTISQMSIYQRYQRLMRAFISPNY